MKTWMHEMLGRVDAMDVPGFVSHFTEDGAFRFGNWPAAVGEAAIAGFTREFFGMIAGIKHEVIGVWESGDQVFTEGAVTYTRKDGKQVTVPFLTRAELRGGKMARYLVFADPSPLLAS
jgi:ketosteroid isomerase-like protein